MFNRRISTTALLALTVVGSGLATTSAQASPAAPAQKLVIQAQPPSEIGLLLPAVQAAREAARFSG